MAKATEVRYRDNTLRAITVFTNAGDTVDIRFMSGSSGVNDWESFFELYGKGEAFFPVMATEKFRCGLAKDEARLVIKQWRQRCRNDGLVFTYSYTGE